MGQSFKNLDRSDIGIELQLLADGQETLLWPNRGQIILGTTDGG